MADPVTLHLVSGKVRDLYGAILSGATVTVTHSTIGSTPSVTTNTAGEYIINLSKLASQWSLGDTITVTASKTAEGTKSVITTIIEEAAGRQTVNITLAETSDIHFNTQSQNVYLLRMMVPTHYDGEKITRERPLPVNITLNRVFREEFAYSGNLVEFHGFADPGADPSESKFCNPDGYIFSPVMFQSVAFVKFDNRNISSRLA